MPREVLPPSASGVTMEAIAICLSPKQNVNSVLLFCKRSLDVSYEIFVVRVTLLPSVMIPDMDHIEIEKVICMVFVRI
jgi:hypothetical protein